MESKKPTSKRSAGATAPKPGSKPSTARPKAPEAVAVPGVVAAAPPEKGIPPKPSASPAPVVRAAEVSPPEKGIPPKPSASPTPVVRAAEAAAPEKGIPPKPSTSHAPVARPAELASLAKGVREKVSEPAATAPSVAAGARPDTGAARKHKEAEKAPERVFVEAPPDKCFWVNMGPILRNLRDLHDALTTGLTDQQYLYHAGGERNDFAGWVEAVLLEPDCAADLRRSKTRSAAARALKKHLELP